MAPISSSFARDANGVPIAFDGLTTSVSQTLSGSNTTVSTPLFRITGSIEVRALYGVVTTVLGSNLTATHWRLNDQTAQPVITLVTGTTISSATVGSVLSRRNLVSGALTLMNASAGIVNDPIAATAPSYFMPFVLVQKTAGVNSDIEFTYTTTNTPTSGVIKHYLRWIPLSDDGNVTAL